MLSRTSMSSLSFPPSSVTMVQFTKLSDVAILCAATCRSVKGPAPPATQAKHNEPQAGDERGVAEVHVVGRRRPDEHRARLAPGKVWVQRPMPNPGVGVGGVSRRGEGQLCFVAVVRRVVPDRHERSDSPQRTRQAHVCVQVGYTIVLDHARVFCPTLLKGVFRLEHDACDVSTVVHHLARHSS